MNHPHLIETAVLDINFTQESLARQFQEDGGSFFKERLLPIVEEYFNEFNHPDMVYSIDLLEVDLGTIHKHQFQEELENRFRQQLKDSLKQQLATVHVNQSPVSKSSWTQSAWQQLRYFLEHGYLPWNADQQSPQIIERLFTSTCNNHLADFVVFLRENHRDLNILKRLIHQFSDDVLQPFILRLSQEEPSFFTQFTETLVECLSPFSKNSKILPGTRARGNQDLETLRPHHKTFEFEAGRQSERTLKVGDDIKDKLSQLLTTGTQAKWQSLWERLLKQYTKPLQETIRYCGQLAWVRKKWAYEFLDPMLRDMIVLLEPTESEFIQEMVDRPQLFQPITSFRPSTSKTVKQQLWEFTLGYLLVERGSRFNKKTYLESLIRQMAARHNQHFHDTLNALLSTLNEVEVPSTLKKSMLYLLMELAKNKENASQQEKETDQEQPQHSFKKIQPRLEKALLESDLKELWKQWNFLFVEQRSWLQKTIRYCGQLAWVRRKWSQRLLDAMLSDVIVLLEPSESGFIQEIVSRPQLFQPTHAPRQESHPILKQQLWEFTLGYLLVESGSIFNKKVYLESLLRQMAAHRNQSWFDLLEVLLQTLETFEMPSPLKQTMQSLLHELRDENNHPTQRDNPFHEESAEPSISLEHLEQAIQAGDVQTLRSLWSLLLSQRRIIFEKTLRQYGKWAKVRQKLSQNLSDAMLQNVIVLLEPQAAGWVLEIVKHHSIFARKSPSKQQTHAKVERKQLFWNFTLTYLLIERGSAFNKKIYLASLIRQMAAHENVYASDLFFSIMRAIKQLKPSSSFQAMLLPILQDLQTYFSDSFKCPEPIERAQQETVEAYHHYQIVWNALSRTQVFLENDPISQQRFEQSLQHLVRNHPIQLQQIFNEMRVNSSLEKWIQWFTIPIFKQLISALLSLTESGSPESSVFFQSINKFAAQASDQKRYWFSVLQALIQGRMIDLEALSQDDPDRSHMLPGNEDWNAPRFEHQLVEHDVSAVPSSTGHPSFPFDTPDGLDRRLRDLLDAPFFQNNAQSTALSPHDVHKLQHVIERYMLLKPNRLKRLLESLAHTDDGLIRLMDLLPEQLKVRLLILMKGAEFLQVQPYANLIANACYGENVMKGNCSIQALKWKCLIQYFIEEGRPFHRNHFIQFFVEFLTSYSTEPRSFQGYLSQRLLQSVVNPGIRELAASIVEVIAEKVDSAVIPNNHDDSPESPMSQHSQGLATEFSENFQHALENTHESEDFAFVEEVYIQNAGLVLANPYLPQLFDKLHLTENRAFKDRDCAERAIHLLQYLACESHHTPEYQLVLNKILCGVITGEPISRTVDLHEEEMELVESLIQGMIAHWKVLGNTSVAGFRESFLQRQGQLRLREDGWHLRIETKAFDVLLDQLPWNYSIIKYPWMDQGIQVEWRPN